jgi:hypothetical protein
MSWNNWECQPTCRHHQLVSVVRAGYHIPRRDALTSKIDTYRRDHDARKRAAFVGGSTAACEGDLN